MNSPVYILRPASPGEMGRADTCFFFLKLLKRISGAARRKGIEKRST
jgi:hypothetical protein